jgi:iron-sulfur cluster repair protein YtfE (RIC family)
MARRKPRPLQELRRRTVGELIAENSKVLHLLDEHGITFCAGCYLTLMAAPERAAVYHAVPDVKKFLRQLEKVLAPPKKRR